MKKVLWKIYFCYIIFLFVYFSYLDIPYLQEYLAYTKTEAIITEHTWINYDEYRLEISYQYNFSGQSYKGKSFPYGKQVYVSPGGCGKGMVANISADYMQKTFPVGAKTTIYFKNATPEISFLSFEYDPSFTVYLIVFYVILPLILLLIP